MNLHELENILLKLSMDASLMSNMQYNTAINATINMLSYVGNLASIIQSGQVNDTCKSMMTQKIYELEAFAANTVIMRFAELGLDLSLYGGLPMMSNPIPSMPMMNNPMTNPLGMMPMMSAPMGMPVSQPMMMPPQVPPMMQQPMMQQPMMQQPMMQQAPVYQPPPPPPPEYLPAPQPPPAAETPSPPPPAAAPSPPAAPAAKPAPATPPPAAAAPPPVTPPAEGGTSSGGGLGVNLGLPGAGGANDGPAEGRDYLLKVIEGLA